MSQPIPAISYVYIESKMAPKKVFDISQDVKNHGSLILYDYHGASNQHFVIIPADNGEFYIQSQQTSKVLTIFGHSDVKGTKIIEEANNKQPAQRFRLQ
jgi:hypothetical protein